MSPLGFSWFFTRHDWLLTAFCLSRSWYSFSFSGIFISSKQNIKTFVGVGVMSTGFVNPMLILLMVSRHRAYAMLSLAFHHGFTADWNLCLWVLTFLSFLVLTLDLSRLLLSNASVSFVSLISQWVISFGWCQCAEFHSVLWLCWLHYSNYLGPVKRLYWLSMTVDFWGNQLQSSNWTSDLFSTYSYIFNVN